MGFTDGTSNYGTVSDGTNVWKIGIRINQYGQPVGNASGGSDGSNKNIGLTQDPTKSGIIVETDADLVVCIKY